MNADRAAAADAITTRLAELDTTRQPALNLGWEPDDSDTDPPGVYHHKGVARPITETEAL